MARNALLELVHGNALVRSFSGFPCPCASPPLAPAPPPCRELVDGGYESWLSAMGAAVETLGASDAKHGARLRLENYAFLQLALQVAAPPRSPLCMQPAAASMPTLCAGQVQRTRVGKHRVCALASGALRRGRQPRHAVAPLQSLPLDRSPALRGYAAQAAAQLDRALGRYVEQQVEHLKLARVLEFGRVRAGAAERPAGAAETTCVQAGTQRAGA